MWNSFSSPLNEQQQLKREQYASVHFAPALSHATMRDAVRAVTRSFGIQFPGEPIEKISVLELLLESRDHQLRRIRQDMTSAIQKDDDDDDDDV